MDWFQAKIRENDLMKAFSGIYNFYFQSFISYEVH